MSLSYRFQIFPQISSRNFVQSLKVAERAATLMGASHRRPP
jgi:hypothetical protein